jgi:UDP-glucose 4-epimerase
MRILVTGGAGFIGSHMADRLVADGHEVTVIDNLATGLRENVPETARFIKGDVTRLEDLEAAFAGGIDAVFQIAGQVSLIRSFTDPVVDLRTNVQGTVNVLQMCIKHRVPRLLYASSMTVYGNDPPLPTPEQHPCEPVSYYGITKYAGERYVLTTAQRPDLDFEFRVTAFRMYNVYGPRQALDNPYQGVLGIFLGNLLRGEPIRIFGDGEQSRDFIYIGDIVDAWVGALENPAAYAKVFNLGSGHRLSINALADAALSAFDRSRIDCPVEYAPARPGEQRQVEADISRARRLLSWEPRVSFAEGMVQTVRWATETAGYDKRVPAVSGPGTPGNR